MFIRKHDDKRQQQHVERTLEAFARLQVKNNSGLKFLRDGVLRFGFGDLLRNTCFRPQTTIKPKEISTALALGLTSCKQERAAF